eukprot:TRINITY_DN11872_c0_g1_i2.p1 TRINITY_DN11872_c0_g1~~TRINITY_DN11872_c0_g1_i2.p1  ORF type:complete len:193 (+),score=25.32 TRINITY_DN11872_c0_g1_i2:158-736(+)
MCIRDRVSTQSTGAFSTAIGSPAGAWVLVLFSCMPLSDPLNDLLTEVFTLMDEQGREGTKLVDLPQWISVHRRWCDEMGHSFDEDATRASFALHDLDEVTPAVRVRGCSQDGSLDLQEWLQAADKCLTHNDTDQPSGFTLVRVSQAELSAVAANAVVCDWEDLPHAARSRERTPPSVDWTENVTSFTCQVNS